MKIQTTTVEPYGLEYGTPYRKIVTEISPPFSVSEIRTPVPLRLYHVYRTGHVRL